MFIDACCTIGDQADPEPSAEVLLTQMDKAGVDRAVIHPPDRGYAWENVAGNDLVIAAASAYPDRFIPAVTVNPWRPDAWDVLDTSLQGGGKLLSFAPGVQGFVVSAHHLDPILNKLAEANMQVPIYVHTGHHSHAAPAQLAMLAQRFTQLTFIMGHCGSTDFAVDVVPVSRTCPNIYMESSFARPPGFVTRLTETGSKRALMGSGFPYNDLGYEWSEMRRLLPGDLHESVLGGTLGEVLGVLK